MEHPADIPFRGNHWGRDNMKLSGRLLILGLIVGLCAAPAAAEGFNPFEFFNVYSLDAIGSQASPYHSDFQGIGGAGGDCHFSYFSINDLGLIPSPYSLHVGGTLAFTGAIRNGGIEGAGAMILTGVSVEGDIACGADFTGNGGSSSGDISAAGTVALTGFTVGGAVSEGQPFVPCIDLDAVSSFFLDKSDEFAGWADTGTPSIGGQVVFTATLPGVNVFTVDATALDSAWGVLVQGSGESWVIVNVFGTTAALTTMDWQVQGIDPSHVLFNFPEALSLLIHQVGVVGNLLAPHALCDFPAGLVTGCLWVGELQGGGQVNFGFFTEPTPPTDTESRSWGDLKRLYR